MPRRRTTIAFAVLAAGGLVGAALGIAVATDGPGERQRSREATNRDCGHPYVEVATAPLERPRFTLEGVGRAQQPVSLAVDPAGRRPTLLGEREGTVRVVDERGRITPEVVLDLRDTSDHGDGGLLAVVHDPGDDWVYVLRTTSGQDDVLTAYPVGPDGRPDQGGEVELLRSGHPTSEQHHGGGMAFGPDGLLYVGLGDGGGLGDPRRNAQRPSTILGKILRIDPTPDDLQEPYRIPPDNPFLGRDGWRPEIWAYGVRNPYRLTFDADGALWLGDVGQSCWEEIDVLTAADAGANLGWDRFEGSAPFQPGDLDGHVVWPVHTIPHGAGWCALVVGYVVDEPALGELNGWLLHTDFCRGRIVAFRPGDGVLDGGTGPRVVDTGLRVEHPTAIVQGPDGLPWILSLDGEVLRLVARG